MGRRLLIVLGVVALLAAACSRGGRIIPKGTMEDIYYDMLMADQWLNDHYAARRVADTTLFYEPVFRKYGYTFKDYDKSVSHYLKNPEKFSKMFDRVSKRLERKAKDLEKVRQAIENYVLPGGYEPSEFRPDTIVWADSLVRWARPVVLPPEPEKYPCDSLCPFRDSLGCCRCDSICPWLDSLGRHLCDSLKISETEE